MFRRAVILMIVFSVGLLICPPDSLSRKIDSQWINKMKHMKWIWDHTGTGVHNIGNLQMHVTNWGAFGSYPSSRYPTNEFPSAQWPANSGVEYLYISGLWVGANMGDVKVVSTAAYQAEFQPDSKDELARIYASGEGAAGGARLPLPADDDKDGQIDEDWLNGYDDDGDGLIDEDFAAIGKQMFSCWFTDDQPTATKSYPEHTPLGLFVRQESYQWEEEQFYNFVGVEYKFTNYGEKSIEDMYVGFFADGDAGPRTRDQYWMDDMTCRFPENVNRKSAVVCAQKGDKEIPVNVNIAYFYDDDGDEGETEGYFGILFLGHDTDPLGEDAPRELGITSYQNFSGDQPFEDGGDPNNDNERYELMSVDNQFDRCGQIPRDYRMLMAVGPFAELVPSDPDDDQPDETMVLQVAFVCGKGLEGMKEVAASAASAYDGNWFNVDGDPETGTKGRETPIPGPVDQIEPDSCDGVDELLSCPRGEVIWVNVDCREEDALWNSTKCDKSGATKKDYQTGVYGKETHINWLVGSAPPPPSVRLLPRDGRVVVFWDNFSEVTPDVSTLKYDFEGYRVWRADGWDRPIGTSIQSGPARRLWQLLEERDLVVNRDGSPNAISPNRNFKEPWPDGWEYEPLSGVDEKETLLEMFEETVYQYPMDTVPCPAGLSDAQCDTLEALARFNLGFEGGKQYYKYVDDSVHNGMHYFYSVTAYDHLITAGKPVRVNKFGDPSSNFQYVNPLSDAQRAEGFRDDEIYVVPNPATPESMVPWELNPNMDDPTGIKVEFRNLPACRSTVRIFTLSGDLVEIINHDGRDGHGTLRWDLVSRNGQDVTSGVYLFAVDPEDDSFSRTVGKFVVIR